MSVPVPYVSALLCPLVNEAISSPSKYRSFIFLVCVVWRMRNHFFCMGLKPLKQVYCCSLGYYRPKVIVAFAPVSICFKHLHVTHRYSGLCSTGFMSINLSEFLSCSWRIVKVPAFKRRVQNPIHWMLEVKDAGSPPCGRKAAGFLEACELVNAHCWVKTVRTEASTGHVL